MYPYDPHQPHAPIDCPHCSHKSVVQIDPTTYACLNCRFRFELDGYQPIGPFGVGVMGILLLVVMLLLL
ncbi:MAG: hypothetical protein AAFY20_26915 [Cyanobacteria bacterium J06639_14]